MKRLRVQLGLPHVVIFGERPIWAECAFPAEMHGIFGSQACKIRMKNVLMIKPRIAHIDLIQRQF